MGTVSTQRGVLGIESGIFRKFGRILSSQGLDSVLAVADSRLTIPAEGVVYQASLDFLESLPRIQEIGDRVFGGCPIQAGWCIGKSQRLNALEYHNSSEVIIAITDLVLMLGSMEDLKDGWYPSDRIEIFRVPRGTAIELLPEVLHFAPQHLVSEGFAGIIMLPKGTNSPLPQVLMDRVQKARIEPTEDHELSRLWMINKWMICHPDSPHAGRGARIGIRGENIELQVHQ